MLNVFKKSQNDSSFHNKLILKIGDVIRKDEFLHEKQSEFMSEWLNIREGKIFVGDEDEMAHSFNQCINSFIYEYELPNGQTVLEHLSDKSEFFDKKELGHLKKIRKNFYSVFDIEDVDPGKTLFLRDLLTDKKYVVPEKNGAVADLKGGVLFGRLCEYDKLFTLLCNDGMYPESIAYSIKRNFSIHREAFKGEPLSSKLLHNVALKKEDPEDRLIAGINLQKQVKKIFAKIYGKKFKFKKIQKELSLIDPTKPLDPQMEPYINLIKAKLPYYEHVKAIEVFHEFVHSLFQQKVNQDSKEVPKEIGPMEKMLIEDLMSFVQSRHFQMNVTDFDEMKKINEDLKDDWLDSPQKELGGKKPMEVILEERDKLGNPNKEFSFQIVSQTVGKNDNWDEKKYDELKKRATILFKEFEFFEAIENFKKMIE